MYTLVVLQVCRSRTTNHYTTKRTALATHIQMVKGLCRV